MRAPRAHPTTVVFTFGARKSQELPFVIGVMSDLTGKAPTAPEKPKDDAPEELKSKYAEDLKRYEAYLSTKKNFLEIESGNFNSRMAAMRPSVNLKEVPNLMTEEGGNLSPLNLEFQSMDDFRPDNVAKQVKPLRDLLEQRERLKTLTSQMDGKEDAEKVLEDLLKKVEALTKGAS